VDSNWVYLCRIYLSLSPWSANSIAITNQSNRFISLVKSNDLLMNDVLDKSKYLAVQIVFNNYYTQSYII
jgi:hypothetical protein